MLEESHCFGGWRTSQYFQHSSHVQMLSQKLDSRISTRITPKPNCGFTIMITGPLNSSKTIQSKWIAKWGQTISQLSPDSPRKAPTRKANFVEVLERWGSVPMRQLAFYFCRKGVVGCLVLFWMFPFKRKGANSYSQRLPQTRTPFRTFDITWCI